jgi:hypothetical protein
VRWLPRWLDRRPFHVAIAALAAGLAAAEHPGTVVLAAIGLGLGLSAFAAGFYDLSVWGPIALGVLAAVAFVVGIGGFDERALTSAVALLGAEYGTFLYLSGEATGGATAVYAAGLVLASELAYWSLELRTPTGDAPSALRRRAVSISATVVGAFVVAGMVAFAAGLGTDGGFVLDIIGAVALTAALALVAQLAKR